MVTASIACYEGYLGPYPPNNPNEQDIGRYSVMCCGFPDGGAQNPYKRDTGLQQHARHRQIGTSDRFNTSRVCGLEVRLG